MNDHRLPGFHGQDVDSDRVLGTGLHEGGVEPSVLGANVDYSLSSVSSGEERMESDGEVYLPASERADDVADVSDDETDVSINDETSSSSACDVIRRDPRMLCSEAQSPPPTLPSMVREMLEAVLAGDTAAIRLLLQDGAEANATCCEALFDPVRVCDGDAAIHIACRLGYADVLETLLHHGADVDQISGTGKRAVHLASVRGHVQCVQVLVQ